MQPRRAASDAIFVSFAPEIVADYVGIDQEILGLPKVAAQGYRHLDRASAIAPLAPVFLYVSQPQRSGCRGSTVLPRVDRVKT